jgi:hypothetical protein
MAMAMMLMMPFGLVGRGLAGWLFLDGDCCWR